MPHLFLLSCRSMLPAAVFILFIAGSANPGAAADSIWAPPQLEKLIEEALANNQSLRSRVAQVEGLE
ncbi:MAG: hypothetical protein ACOCTJ_02775, partial [Desulfobia sp.]